MIFLSFHLPQAHRNHVGKLFFSPFLNDSEDKNECRFSSRLTLFTPRTNRWRFHRTERWEFMSHGCIGTRPAHARQVETPSSPSLGHLGVERSALRRKEKNVERSKHN